MFIFYCGVFVYVFSNYYNNTLFFNKCHEEINEIINFFTQITSNRILQKYGKFRKNILTFSKLIKISMYIIGLFQYSRL